MTDIAHSPAPGKRAASYPAKGLAVQRVYTTAGVHPYDEVSWERRDVVLTNWRDGSINFDQRGVEFPDSWSVNAANIVTTKYFRGAVGTAQRESSLRQLIDRVVLTYSAAGRDNGYFASPEDVEVFEHELTWMLLHQVFSFNSPVWFNVGTSSPQQVSACFILAVEDTMDSILNWYREEGLIFKGGSGAGLNLSRIRSSKELLSSGGTASGPVSFMRGADASAGTIKSGGATRRAAKMVVLDVDHPDIEEFIATKAREENKIRALRDAGFDMDLGGTDITSVQYQNANNSVRVNEEFMTAVQDGTDFGLRARQDGRVLETVDAKKLFRSMTQAAWACADPGIQYDDTINDWHTNPETGRITASNPCCFVGETLVVTDDGPVPFVLLHKALEAGESIAVGSRDKQTGEFVSRPVTRAWIAGEATRLVEVQTSLGARLLCTPEHRFLTADGWMAAETLVAGTRLVSPGMPIQVLTVSEIELDEPVAVYDLEVEGTHNFLVAGEGTSGVVVHNSEYLSLDNSSCNLASLNLMKFLNDDGTFDAVTFAKAVEIVITAMDISICFADFPTEPIGETTRAYRQLGIGYANLGALLMATGHAYDSRGGQSLAAAITSLMTGTAYKRSAELAGIVGPYDGFARNAAPHARVMRKHAAANDQIRPLGADDAAVLKHATKAWQDGLAIGAENGWRNAQASVLAPTGCLTGDMLITTDRGLVRLSEVGDPYGDRWQELEATVSTDEGPQRATQFFVNGEEPTRQLVTTGGYQIQGTLAHRIKIVDRQSGEWKWKRMADVAAGDIVPMQLGTLVGSPRDVVLPVLDQAYYAGDRHVSVPNHVDEDLAELVGYFMGDGSLHAKGIRLCLADTDLDAVERLRILSKQLFHLEPVVRQMSGYQEVTLQSVRLARWWQAAGFAKSLPYDGHTGKGWVPRVPSAVLETNAPDIYAAFLRGLFKADGAVLSGVPSVSTAHAGFAAEIRTVLLALAVPTTTRETVSGWGGPVYQVRLRNLTDAAVFGERVGFLSNRKAGLVGRAKASQPGNRDRVHLAGQTWLQIVPVGHELRGLVQQAVTRGVGLSRDLARRVHEVTQDPRVGYALGYLFEQVAANEDGGVQPTYDLSVPSNVTYVAGGFVSHNTIGFMMDCDTTGIEPDFSLVKFKKLVGGGSMQIVNQTVPRALTSLGYQDEQVEAIVEYIAEHGHVVDAPGLRPEHYEVFDCAMGERAITPMGHVRMMSAVQPFISGAISKCVVGETLIASEDGLVRINSLHRGEAEDSFRDEKLLVSSLDGPRKTDAFYYGGVRPVRRVQLRSGHSITGTDVHRVLVAGVNGTTWKHLREIGPGDYVGMQYGAQMWSTVPASLRWVAVSPPYGGQKRINLPAEMTEELAFLLGAYAAEGHTTRVNYTVTITNSVRSVLERVRDAWRSEFGLKARIVEQTGKCPGVIVASKTLVEFLEALGCGSRASNKRIPDAVLRSPQRMVIAFLQGLALDAYVTTGASTKWAICLDSPLLLDDLQSVMTNLGVVHGRVTKHNKTNGKNYDEVYAAGPQGQLMTSIVPFLEPDKAARAAEYLNMDVGPGTADVVPGITGRELYELMPPGRRGRGGVRGWRAEFPFLLDARVQHVTRRMIERVSTVPGVQLPNWLQEVLDGNVHFSPVVIAEDAGDAPVYDLSVPATHAFVGNGIVNHNTVNMPEIASVEDVEEIYFQGWKMGLKALAIYRDNCKVGQPLSDGKAKKVTAEPEVIEVNRPTRKRLPKSRPARTTSFSVGGAEGYMTASSYPDDGLGEVFLKMSKQGSTLAGLMDAFSIAISIALQYGVPLETYVSKFTNMRFDPAGMTDDADVRLAQSVMDYIFRRLALDHLPYEKRAGLGIFTADERIAQATAASAGTAVAEPALVGDDDEVDLDALRSSAPVEKVVAKADLASEVAAKPAPRGVGSSAELLEAVTGKSNDAPLCMTCGVKMRPAGSCYVCEGCGSTSGCS